MYLSLPACSVNLLKFGIPPTQMYGLSEHVQHQTSICQVYINVYMCGGYRNTIAN